jgi:YVTN family beta-propeller protein
MSTLEVLGLVLATAVTGGCGVPPPAAAPAAPSAPAAPAASSPSVAPDGARVTPLVMSRAAITSGDRVYAANQTSNTVSVVDPSAPGGGALVGEIVLGAPRTEVLSPIYRGQLNVHGLGFSPDHKTIVAVSIGSNSVTFIDTATNAVKGIAYIGRAPHEAFFTPDGREVWAAVRGESYLSVIDAQTFKETLFRPDGRVAFVVSSFTPEVDVIDVATRAVVARVPVVSPFSPDLFISSDGRELWMTHKDVGKVTIIDAVSFKVKSVLDTGPITNHVALLDTSRGNLAFVTVGGLNEVKVFTRDEAPKLVATIPTGALPHGLWPSDDQTRLYVGLENGDAVSVIDAIALEEVARIPIGQAPQALIYVSKAAPAGATSSNLKALGEAQRPVEITLQPPSAAPPAPAAPPAKGGGLVVVRGFGLVDTVDVNVFGLEPDRRWLLVLDDGPAHATTLAAFATNAKGVGAAQVTGPVRRSSGIDAPARARRGLRVVAEGASPGAAPRLAGPLP